MSKRIADFGVRVGALPSGKLGKITDVPGVTVGHATVDDSSHHTGVTVIMPCADNMFVSKLTAAAFVLNGFGKTQGLVQVGELGTLETPIALTNTLNVGLVHDAIVSYMAQRCAADGVDMRSINPVVGECNDANLNDIADRPVRETHVRAAIDSACVDFAEGCVGAGAGTVCHGLKGGIGSASRLLPIGGRMYTLGVLVQSNYGALSELTVCGRRVGEEIVAKRRTKAAQRAPARAAQGKDVAVQETTQSAAEAVDMPASPDDEPLDRGSIMIVLATDLPVSDRQLGRILKRCAAGLARCGSYYGHGSGDVMIGFSTANRVPHESREAVIDQRVLAEPMLELAFRAAAEATEEAVITSLFAAHETVAANGKVYESLAKHW